MKQTPGELPVFEVTRHRNRSAACVGNGLPDGWQWSMSWMVR
ncbi:hypothetical protein L838_0980 [Mycobacterium avium MAV_120709_2344]|nr:hypothetical protein L838_0980 [Mycobacterium avium MAV_120709_2344]